MKPSARQEALALGHSTYVSGKACVWGHTSPRMVKDSRCAACAALRGARIKAGLTSQATLKRLRRGFLGRQVRTDYGRKSLGVTTPIRPAPLDNRCECCGQVDMKRQLALDHDHVTGAFRGWLCNLCNMGIGQLGDNLAGVSLAVSYLTRSVVYPDAKQSDNPKTLASADPDTASPRKDSDLCLASGEAIL